MNLVKEINNSINIKKKDNKNNGKFEKQNKKSENKNMIEYKIKNIKKFFDSKSQKNKQKK